MLTSQLLQNPSSNTGDSINKCDSAATSNSLDANSSSISNSVNIDNSCSDNNNNARGDFITYKSIEFERSRSEPFAGNAFMASIPLSPVLDDMISYVINFPDQVTGGRGIISK